MTTPPQTIKSNQPIQPIQQTPKPNPIKKNAARKKPSPPPPPTTPPPKPPTINKKKVTSPTNPPQSTLTDTSDNSSFIDLYIDQDDTPLKHSLSINLNTIPNIIYSKQSKRNRNKWSDEEVIFLMEGYELFKDETNKWSKILKQYSFNNRNAVDLKDKHRNSTKKTSYHAMKKRKYVLVDENLNVLLDEVGGNKIYYERFPFEAAVKIAKDLNFSGDKEIVISYEPELSAFYRYSVKRGCGGNIKVAAVSVKYM